MDIRILDTIDYQRVAKILYESYIPQWGSVGSPEWNANYIEYLDKTYIKPRNGLYVGAFEGENIIGIGFGVLPEYQRKGIATSMVKKLAEAATIRNVKLIYRICRDELYDHRVLANCGFSKKINNVHHIVRIMGSDMIEKLAYLKGMGRAMKLLLKIVAGLPKESEGVQYGIIRDGQLSDVEDCVKILNAYRDSTSITRRWTEEEFRQFINTKDLLIAPFRAFLYVWEREGRVRAFIAGRVESIQFQNGIGSAIGIIDTGFSNDLIRQDKTSFIISNLFQLKELIPNGFGINLVVAHHEKKAFDKAGFTDDRSTRPLYVKVLSDDLQNWLETAWNFKAYYIPYQR
jgi:GNAT superfamily N-acetyltransferase